jgi:hypothetical protein
MEASKNSREDQNAIGGLLIRSFISGAGDRSRPFGDAGRAPKESFRIMENGHLGGSVF